MNSHDLFLQQLVPTVIVPRHEPFEFLKSIGHRMVMASNGLFLEVKRNWLHLIHMVAPIGGLTLPYGEVKSRMELLFDFPIHLVRTFYQDALTHFPNECGAWLIQNTDTGEFRYEMLKSLQATCSFLEVVRPVLDGNEVMVVDLHSHGYHRAEFSDLDDKDDCAEYKISGVIGSIGEHQQATASFRLCAGGVYVPFKVNIATITDIV